MIGKVSILLIAIVPFLSAGTWQVNTDYKIDHSVNNNKLELTFTLSNGKTGWMGFCFNEFMYPADCIVCQYNTNKGECFDSFNPGVTNVPFYPAPVVDTYNTNGASFPVMGNHGKDNLSLVSTVKANNQIVIKVNRALDTLDKYDQLILCGNTYKVNAAYHSATLWNTTPGSAQTKHSASAKSSIKFC